MSTLKNLQKKIKINFKNEKILLQAITHKSYDPLNNNEKMEFLGDRVLGLIISEKLRSNSKLFFPWRSNKKNIAYILWQQCYH